MASLIQVGEIVMVAERDVKLLDGTIRRGAPPFCGKVVGYDLSRTKYKVAREMLDGRFSEFGSYYFLHEVTRVD